MRRRQSHIPDGLPAIAAPPRPSPPPPPEANIPVSVDEDDCDDQAETRLFRPKIDIVAATTRRERTSSKSPVAERPSRPSRPLSRPGALILIPADVPSVRVRSDSDIELMDTRMSEAGIVPARRRRSLSSALLIAGATIAVMLLLTHELALALHLPWLDPRNLFVRGGGLR